MWTREKAVLFSDVLLQPLRPVAVLMGDGFKMRLSREWLSKSLMKEQRREHCILYLEPQSQCHLHSVCVHKLLSLRDKTGRKWEDGADLPVVHYQLLFPPHHLCLSTISSNWILCSDVLSPISSLCFTRTIVLFPLHFLHPQPHGPLTSLPQTR